MTVTLELKPEVEERVRAQASAQGVSLERYLTAVIETQTCAVSLPDASLDEFLAELEQFSEGTEDIPIIPPEALTREWIYRDHD